MTWTGGPSFLSLMWLPIGGFAYSRGAPALGLTYQRIRRAATSCGFDGNQFVLNIMQLHHSRTDGSLLKMQRYGLKNILRGVLSSSALR